MGRKQTKKSKKTAPPETPAKRKSKKPVLPEAAITTTGTNIIEVVANGTNVEAATSVEVVTNGTSTGMLGKPVFLEPTTEHAIASNFICRSDLDPQEPLEPLSPTVIGLKELVGAMSTNKDIAPFKKHIQQTAANQPEKGDVVRAYVNQANHELLADMIEMRANAVRHIKRATRRNDVSVSEALVVWRMSNNQIPDLTKGLENDRAVDTVTVIEKIDFQRQQTERTVQKRWEGTTPQGRELIRKKLWELEQRLNAERGIFPKGVEPPEIPEDVSAEEVEYPAKPA